ncbi:two component, sigma54 specific, transcriptional regulator, Fis family [Leptospirillum ferriphilum]|jgi:two-component system response regulator FlrC|nr:two-component response regulator [Leptospirillum sp. Group II 'CF-1']EDZ39494.1 MAG: Putative response regulator receiver protein [Leptospirillum sp. Group II '5-way CG']EIJ77061.1 MAG: Putative response regulator receiver protein [Leptospirillum sp. Group II 'C75']KGA95099.1 two component, sigma54 specific, transcriptional regulator, Fis family [Leptospirillum ferriphilum]
MVASPKDLAFTLSEPARPKVLVVEDDVVALDLLEEILKRGGFGVSVAQSCEEALERLKKDSISLILTDIKMPGKTGMDLLKTVQDLYPELPVVLLTAFGDEHLWVEALSSGAIDLIPKPFRKQEVLDIVQRTLSQPRPPENRGDCSRP